jgi:hypothetical protein
VEEIEQHLNDFVAGRAAHSLSIVYSDMHWLWGGVTITLSSSGAYERLEHLRDSIVPDLVRKTVSPAHVQQVIHVLLEIRAWEQQALQRTPMQDEALATLTLRADSAETSIWELYKKLERNGRLLQVRRLLLELAKE